jgi:hypothetical protein
MQFRWRRSPQIAVAMVCGTALVSLYLYQRDLWRDCATQHRTALEQIVAKYEGLRPLLPVGEAAGFVLDQQHVDPKLALFGARIGLARYAVAPRRLIETPDARWVVVESDRPEIVPEIAASAHWTLCADLRNGIRLYRTNGNK